MSLLSRSAEGRSGRLVDVASGIAARSIDRRGLLARFSLVGAAIATGGVDFVLRPGSAYASVCGSGSSCGSGWTAMCCTIHDGVNQCPPGTFAGGWWKAAGASLCGGKARYYVDCQAKCTKCGCGGRHFCRRGCANCRSKCAKGSCDKRKTCHNQFRYGQCNRDISCSGPIACRAISCTPPWKWEDCSTASATDNHTRSHSASCLPVWSTIMKRYTAMGSQASVLGGTIGKEYDGRTGRIQRYQRGRMYWSKATGPHWLDKDLLARYRVVGQAPLGLPTGDAHAAPGGRGVVFQRGGIYQGSGHVAGAMWARVWDVWLAHDTYRGPLGYPRTSQARTKDGRGTFMRFAGGVIVDGPATPTCALWGPTAAKYAALAYERGQLGYPRTELAANTDVDGASVWETRFEHGTVVASGATAFAVWGPIHERWRAEGGLGSGYGRPVSDVVRLDQTRETCAFNHGSLTYDATTGQVQPGP